MRKRYPRKKISSFEPYNIPQQNIPTGVIVAVNRQIFPLVLDIIKSAEKTLEIAIFQANINGDKKELDLEQQD